MKVRKPIAPFRIKSNQYGFPCSTYYYIVDMENKIWHTDGVFRFKSLKEISTHGFKEATAAIATCEELNRSAISKHPAEEFLLGLYTNMCASFENYGSLGNLLFTTYGIGDDKLQSLKECMEEVLQLPAKKLKRY